MNDSKSSVTLIFPFDYGRTFIFGPQHREKWAGLFIDSNTGSWSTNRVLPESFKCPFGLTSKLFLKQQDDVKALQDAILELATILDWIDQDALKGEVLFITNGAGFLILKSNLKGDAYLDWMAVIKWGKQAKERLADVADKAAQQYKQRVEKANAPELEFSQDRPSQITELYDAYPLFYLPDKFQPSLDRDFEEIRFENTLLQISWASAYISPLPVNNQQELEADFIVASAAWHTLYRVDELLSKDMRDIYYNKISGQSLQVRTRDFRRIGLTYMEIVDSSYPIRWTLSERHLAVLEKIHEVWKTHLLWDTVGDKTSLLPQYYEQLEENERETRENIFAIAGLLIGLFSLASATADLIGLWTNNPLGPKGFAIAIAVVLIAGLLSGLFLLKPFFASRGISHQSSPRLAVQRRNR